MSEPRERRKAYVVLPVYNEEGRIGSLLRRLDEAMDDAAIPYQVILVDDGSRDGTRQIVQDHAATMPIQMMRHEVNQGLGATIRDGLIAASKAASDRDVIITMDSDDTHAPGLILRMVRMISEGHDVVIASRYREGSRTVGVPFFRLIMSTGASWLFRAVFPIQGVRDYTCGYRAYRAQVLKDAIARYGDQFFDQDGFQCMVDILLKLRKLPLIFGEVPLILRYDLKRGQSKMRMMKTSMNTLRLLWRRKTGKHG